MSKNMKSRYGYSSIGIFYKGDKMVKKKNKSKKKKSKSSKGKTYKVIRFSSLLRK
jgi:hypothetical protein